MDAPSATLDPGVNWRLSQQCTSTQVDRSGGGWGGAHGGAFADGQTLVEELT